MNKKFEIEIIDDCLEKLEKEVINNIENNNSKILVINAENTYDIFSKILTGCII